MGVRRKTLQDGAYWGGWKIGHDLLTLILHGLLVSPRTLFVFVSREVKKFREETLLDQHKVY